MAETLNNLIKFDLHIHSHASSYKEADGIVENSTKENLPILFSKLDENEVALFSITDHNRFDAELYKEAKKLLQTGLYSNVKNILAGVEFDVKLEEHGEKCHIITIFDTVSEDCFDKIEQEINKEALKDDEWYEKNKFEELLKNIGLGTILIACQRKGLDNHRGKDNSIGDAVDNIEQIVKLGYINALEFQKPKVEGILKSNLHELNLSIALFSGSDCHDWNVYPYHDKNQQNKDFYHSKAKILPTFKGLLMAVSSPETRFNRSEKNKESFVKTIKVAGREIYLSPGMNAIIGENGSGKSTLLDLINQKVTKPHIKKIKEQNDIIIDRSSDSSQIKYVEQGSIVEKFKNPKALFNKGDMSYFRDIDHSDFTTYYRNYSNNLRNTIKNNIAKNECISNLNNTILYKDIEQANRYYVDVVGSLERFSNDNEQAYNDIRKIIISIKELEEKPYMSSYKDKFDDALKILTEILQNVKKSHIHTYVSNAVMNIIESCINSYAQDIKINSTAKDREQKEYEQERDIFIKAIVETVKKSLSKIEWPNFPPVCNGFSSNPQRGFKFNKVANYHQKEMLKPFLKNIFNSDYQNLDKIKNIKTYQELQLAIRGCTSIQSIEEVWDNNFKKFIEASIQEELFIQDAGNQEVGNTLGEMSLSYYKFFTLGGDDWQVLIIDQPEDNISNNKIKKELINYFQNIRESKQIIYVTHNPLLVVNMDVDNVIYVQNNKGKLSIEGGCLEYENGVDILSIIANTMDGGKETIEKRLMFYGKEN